MKPIVLCLTATVLTSALCAQIAREQNNRPYLVISGTKHTNGQNYSLSTTLPSGWAPSFGGVPNDTYSFRGFLGQHATRWSPTAVNGFFYQGRNSAATLGGGVGIQSFETYLIGESGTLGNPAWTQLPQNGGTPVLNFGPAAPIAPGGQSYRVTMNIAQVSLAFPNHPGSIYIVRRWPNNLANDDTPNTWGHASSWQDGPTGPRRVDGFYHQPSNTQTNNINPVYIQWVGYLTSQPVFLPHSDYGQRRIAPLTPELRGHSAGTGFPDLAINPAGINLGCDWDCGTVNAGGFVVPLFNLQPMPFPACFSFAGAEISVNPADPLLNALSVCTALLDPQGLGMLPKLFFPRQAGLAGQWFGVQGIVVDPAFNLTTTGAYWFVIN
jgi:hypothetical protein